MKRNFICLMIATTIIGTMIFSKTSTADTLTGAWKMQDDQAEQVLLFMDGYLTHTTYNKETRQFVQSRGGSYTLENDKLTIQYEFDTKNMDQIGRSVVYKASLQKGELGANINGKEQKWNRIDDSNAPLAGNWKIIARKQNGELQQIHQTGTRKTIKILTGTRFQWAAIDPGTKQFMGTGGGTYTFSGAKYTEQIEFFSRDSSRVGSSLSFDGKLENGDWHHSGLSSKGDPIYEVWSKKK